MGEVNSKFIGLSQYKAPFCFELAGKHFHFVMDSGKEYSLIFLDGEILQWAAKGEPYVWDTYECLKGDETTFLVHVQPTSGNGLLNHSWVIDTAQRLVTFVLMEEGIDDKYPRLIRTTPFFGAIKVPGLELPKIRHHLSKRMVGKHIFWNYNPGFAIQHIYHSPSCIRADSGGSGELASPIRSIEKDLNSPDPEIRKKAEEKVAYYRRRKQFYPFYEEECFHIWISDRLNLMCFLEEIMTRVDPEHDGGGGGILLLQDIERLIDVGVCFSKGEYYMCMAYGDENEDPDPLDTAESPYDWSELKYMPSINWDIPDED